MNTQQGGAGGRREMNPGRRRAGAPGWSLALEEGPCSLCPGSSLRQPAENPPGEAGRSASGQQRPAPIEPPAKVGPAATRPLGLATGRKGLRACPLGPLPRCLQPFPGAPRERSRELQPALPAAWGAGCLAAEGLLLQPKTSGRAGAGSGLHFRNVSVVRLMRLYSIKPFRPRCVSSSASLWRRKEGRRELRAGRREAGLLPEAEAASGAAMATGRLAPPTAGSGQSASASGSLAARPALQPVRHGAAAALGASAAVGGAAAARGAAVAAAGALPAGAEGGGGGRGPGGGGGALAALRRGPVRAEPGLRASRAAAAGRAGAGVPAPGEPGGPVGRRGLGLGLPLRQRRQAVCPGEEDVAAAALLPPALQRDPGPEADGDGHHADPGPDRRRLRLRRLHPEDAAGPALLQAGHGPEAHAAPALGPPGPRPPPAGPRQEGGRLRQVPGVCYPRGRSGVGWAEFGRSCREAAAPGKEGSHSPLQSLCRRTGATASRTEAFRTC